MAWCARSRSRHRASAGSATVCSPPSPWCRAHATGTRPESRRCRTTTVAAHSHQTRQQPDVVRSPPVTGCRTHPDFGSSIGPSRCWTCWEPRTIRCWSSPAGDLVHETVARFATWRPLVLTVVIDGRRDRPDGAVLDPELRAHKRYGALSGRLVLVRPDGYIARTAALSDPEILEHYLQALVPRHRVSRPATRTSARERGVLHES